MADMLDKRRDKRMSIKLSLEVSSLFRQDNVQVKDINAPIEVTDVSKGGIGFISGSVLPVDYYFNARFDFGGENNAFNGVVRIIRCMELSDGRYSYGCEFVGKASVFDYIFEDIEKRYAKD